MGEHSAPPPRPQDWEEAVGVNADYDQHEGTGLKEGLARILEHPDQVPMPVDVKYKGAKESLKTLFPEVARIKTTVQNALGRLAIWRTAQPEVPSEQQQINETHQAMQAVADEITQEHEVLQATIPAPYQARHAHPEDPYQARHAAPPSADTLIELALHAATEEFSALNAKTIQLPTYKPPQAPAASEQTRESSDDSVHQDA